MAENVRYTPHIVRKLLVYQWIYNQVFFVCNCSIFRQTQADMRFFELTKSDQPVVIKHGRHGRGKSEKNIGVDSIPWLSLGTTKLGYPTLVNSLLIWLVVEPPLWKILLTTQLGWWHSQSMEKSSIHVPNHQPVISLPEATQGICSYQDNQGVFPVRTMGISVSPGS